MRYTNRLNIFRLFNLVLIIFISYSATAQEYSSEKRIMTVVIDAGHGGKDPGAVCSKGYEKNLVLSIALKLGGYIQENFDDVKVIYTRDKDVFVKLYRRAQIANKAKADLFISIHANANESSKPFGSETYVMGLSSSKSNLAVAKKENAVILKEDNYESQYEGFDPNSAEGQIIFSLYQNEYLNQSLFIAGEIQKQFKNRVGRVDRGVKQAGFWVLYKTVMPSILIEIGFISNHDEAKYLFTEQGQDYMASAIYRAFKIYKKQMFDHAKIDIEPELTKVEEKNNIYYSIQISTSKKKVKKIKPSKFKGFKNVFEYKEGDYYKYFYAKEKNYDELAKIYKNVKKKFPDSFPVAFVDGKKTSVNKAKAISN